MEEEEEEEEEGDDKHKGTDLEGRGVSHDNW